MSPEYKIVKKLRQIGKKNVLDTSNKLHFSNQRNSHNNNLEKDYFANHSLLNSLLENIPDSIYFKDKEGKFVELSQAKANHHRTEKINIIGKTDFDFYSEIEAKKMKNDDIKVIKNEEVKTREEKITRPNGVTTWVSAVKAPRYDINGNVIGLVGISRDITDKKNAENKLRESEERLRDFFDNANDLIQSVDSKGCFNFVNKKWKKQMGYCEEEIKTMHFLDIVRKDYIEHCKHVFKGLSEGKSFDNLEVVFVSKDDDEIYLEGNVNPIIKNDEFIGTRGIFRDITERKKVEEALFESEQKYRTIFENSAVGIMVTNEKEEIVSWNKYAEKLLGMNEKDLKNKPVKKLYSNEEWEKIRKQNIRQKGMQHHLETKILNKKGERVDVDISLSVLREDNGGIIGSIGIMTDISERKKAEAEIKEAHQILTFVTKYLEQKVELRTKEIQNLLKQKDEFINQLGHDLKTPLTPLNSLLPMIKNKIEDEQLQKYLDLTIQNVNYMKNLVQKTLKLALFNSNSFELEFEKINAWEIIDRAIKNRSDECKNKIEFNNLVNKDIMIIADKLRFEELINNLISNSIIYSKEDVNITINAESDDSEVKFSIKDNGIGMTQDQIEKIFDEFYKADKSRHDFNSTGLGLSICKRIMEKHGGKLWVESEGLNKGSIFYFNFKK